MKDYYKTLGISANASGEDIRKAFRKLAFQYHPDKNIGHEKEAEQKFKDLNEAYGVLSDRVKRQQYDMALRGGLAGAGYGSPSQGFRYSQEDIFRDTFTNQATMEELNRMFAQAGLRFDQDFLNRVFFNANKVVFRVYTFGGPVARSNRKAEPSPSNKTEVATSDYKPNFLERWAANITVKLSNFAIRRLFGIQYAPPQSNLDLYQEFDLTAEEANSGGEKEFTYQNGKKSKKLMVKIPSGIQSGTQIHLKGIGRKEGKMTGDLYLRVKVNG